MCGRLRLANYNSVRIDAMFDEIRKFNRIDMGYFIYKLSTIPNLVQDLEEVTAFLRSKCIYPASTDRVQGPWILLSWWQPYERGEPIWTVGRRNERVAYWSHDPAEPSVMGKTLGGNNVRRWSNRARALRDFRSRKSKHYRWLLCREAEAERRILEIVVGMHDDGTDPEGDLVRPGASGHSRGRPAVS